MSDIDDALMDAINAEAELNSYVIRERRKAATDALYEATRALPEWIALREALREQDNSCTHSAMVAVGSAQKAYDDVRDAMPEMVEWRAAWAAERNAERALAEAWGQLAACLPKSFITHLQEDRL